MNKLVGIFGVMIVIIIAMILIIHMRAPPLRRPLLNDTLSLIIEPDNGIGQVVSLISTATSSIDLVMYDLEDSNIERELVAAESRGISVRILLNQGYYGTQSSMNESAYSYLKVHNVPVRWTSSKFALTHEKLVVADHARAIVMGFNFTPRYYASSRDFAISDSDSNDVAALEKVFDADWNAKEIDAPEARDLVWSPNAENEVVSIVSHAKHSLLIYNEEMSDGAVIRALQDAAERGVSVYVIMTYQSSWKLAFLKLIESGVHVRASEASAPLYIHAKMIVADDTEAFIGSENFSETSLIKNRELGILITKPSVITLLISTFGADWNRAYAKLK